MNKPALKNEEITASRKAIEKYLKFVGKISKQKCWEETHQLGGFFMWLGTQQAEEDGYELNPSTFHLSKEEWEEQQAEEEE